MICKGGGQGYVNAIKGILQIFIDFNSSTYVYE